MKRGLILFSIILLVAHCTPANNTDQESDANYLAESNESVFAKNGVKPALERQLLEILSEESFGGWPVYMVFLCPDESDNILFVVGSDFYMRTGIIGAFVFDNTLFTFYICSDVKDEYAEIMNLSALGNVCNDVYTYFGGDPELPPHTFHETYHKFILSGDSLIFVEKRRLKDEIPVYDFSDVRSIY